VPEACLILRNESSSNISEKGSERDRRSGGVSGGASPGNMAPGNGALSESHPRIKRRQQRQAALARAGAGALNSCIDGRLGRTLTRISGASGDVAAARRAENWRRPAQATTSREEEKRCMDGVSAMFCMSSLERSIEG